MKRVTSFIGALSASFIMLGASVAAVVTTPSLLQGQTHDYSVHWRGNGEAIVLSRVVFTNHDTTDQTTLSLGISGSIYELNVLQQIVPQTCAEYDYTTSSAASAINKCIQYTAPDYRNLYYPNYNQVKYERVSGIQKDGYYKFTLPVPVAAEQSGSLIISYATKSYAKTSMGNVSFDFPTFKAQERIQTASINATFDSDIYYAGKKSSTTYAPTGLSSELSGASNLDTKSVSNVISRIGDAGQLSKSASSLAPGDIYHVKGSYATSWFALYRKRIIVSVLLLALFIVGIYWLGKWLSKREKLLTKPRGSGSETDDSETKAVHGFAVMRQSLPKLSFMTLRLSSVFLSLMYALISVLGSTLFVLASSFVVSATQRVASYGSSVASAMFILIFAGIVIGLIITTFCLPVYLSRTRGLRYFFITLAFQLVWIAIACAVLYQITNNVDSPNYVSPYGID